MSTVAVSVTTAREQTFSLRRRASVALVQDLVEADGYPRPTDTQVGLTVVHEQLRDPLTCGQVADATIRRVSDRANRVMF